ncbi:hypothetical protein ABMA57_00250 [Saccharospirillum sp. HFRX-1]|uniref:hypothetical protein n=1 Tax=unclassified Saccharospirillum TaxID=2633430 RepID=UPI0037202E80
MTEHCKTSGKVGLLVLLIELVWPVLTYASDDTALVRAAIEQYAAAVQTQDVDAIMVLVPERGLSDADQYIARERIYSGLQDEASYLYQNLFTRDPIECRQPGGFAPASDATYFDHLDDFSQIKVTQHDVFDFYSIAFPRLMVEGCEIWRFYTEIFVEDGRAYFHSYFAR